MWRLMAIWLVAVASSSMCVWAGPGDDCVQSRDLDRVISGCTDFIKDSNDPSDIATAYHNRGLAYAKKGNRDRAIADFTKAIRINPKLGAAYKAAAFPPTREKVITNALLRIMIRPSTLTQNSPQPTTAALFPIR